MAFPLTPGQAEALQFVLEGHNLLITGQAGVGKSRLVNSILQELNAKRKNVAVICSSGIACTVYDRGVASTVHSFYGFGTADLPAIQVLQRSSSNSVVSRRLIETDVMIWDEASMSSARILELANSLHDMLGSGTETAFGGRQVILDGEFLQLRPVPGLFDDGKFMFASPVFQSAFPHRIALLKVLRQLDGELEFIQARQEIRLGTCSGNSAEYLKTLSRELNSEEEPTHIFFRRLPALLSNRKAVEQLPGRSTKLRATFEGLTENFKWPGQEVLVLKPEARVMLVWNLNDSFKNGSMGIFLGMEGDKALIKFPEGTVKISQQTWCNTNKKGEIIGHVTQYPIILSYAVTCHKVQGLELCSAVVHCSSEFVPGLIYVAISRVKSAAHLQLVNFQPTYLMKPPVEAVEISHSRSMDPAFPDLSCCRQKIHPPEFFVVLDRNDVLVDADDDYSFPNDLIDNAVNRFFEEVEVQEGSVGLEEIFDQIAANQSELALPTELFFRDLIEAFARFRVENPRTDYSRSKNKIIDNIAGNPDLIRTFGNVVWFNCFLLMENYVIENGTDGTEVELSRESFTKVFAKLHEFLTGELFKELMCSLYDKERLSDFEEGIASQVAIDIYLRHFLVKLRNVVYKERNEQPAILQVHEMEAAGKSKVRHVGGWALRKVLENSRRYVRTNIYTEHSSTLLTVQQHLRKCEILENEIIAPYSQLEENSIYKDTLEVTESRQYRNRGLLHITDKGYEFFLQLEQERLNQINDERLNHLREGMLDEAHKTIKERAELRAKWSQCFDTSTLENDHEAVNDLYNDVVERYVKMGSAQYLKDYRRAHNVKKSAELRKRVLQRQQKKKEKSDAVPFDEIKNDKSFQKSTSHGRLSSFIDKHNADALGRAYLKPQLIGLCKAYAVVVARRSTKKIMASLLVQAIRLNRNMPHPEHITITVPQQGNTEGATENSSETTTEE